MYLYIYYILIICIKIEISQKNQCLNTEILLYFVVFNRSIYSNVKTKKIKLVLLNATMLYMFKKHNMYKHGIPPTLNLITSVQELHLLIN
jgi:hypothetical protein